jgi:predicted extracellular nuclease
MVSRLPENLCADLSTEERARLVAQLDRFVALLLRWNKSIQVTAAGTADEIFERHVHDSLALLELLPRAGRVVDVGAGGGFPTERGAASAEQHARQLAKLVLSVQALDPDVAALMELENDGIGPDSALAQFVDALNAAGPHQDWRFVAPSEGPGTDSIRVGIIYRHSRVSPVGGPATTRAGPFANRSRAPLAQAFRAGNGPVFVVVANHFKSKGGCDRASGADADQGDGQACFNATRVDSAQALHDWLATDPTGTRPEGTLVIGDLNAHAQEDPMRLLYALGWRDAFAITGAARPYSYVWAGQSGRLDHALLDAGLAARLRGAVEWHSNADESTRFDYRDDDGRDPWRASDHDPLLLGLDLTR